MMDAPAPVVTFAGPPDMSRLSGGQRVLETVRNDLANHLDRQIIERKVVLDNAQAELASNIEYVIANGKVAQQNAINSLDRRVNLTLGNVLQLANQYGVEPPPPSEIRTRSAYPPPQVLQSAPGQSPQSPIDPSRPYTGWDQGGQSPAESSSTGITCATERFTPPSQEVWKWVVERRLGGIVGIVPEGNHNYDGPDYIVTIMPNWWTAHLYCHLGTLCGWKRPRLLKYFEQIKVVQLGPLRDRKVSGPACDIANQLWPA